MTGSYGMSVHYIGMASRQLILIPVNVESSCEFLLC